MVNDLRELMHEASRPPAARPRATCRRPAGADGDGCAYAAPGSSEVRHWPPARSPWRRCHVARTRRPPTWTAAGVPEVSGPSVRLTDARPAVEGQDYRELASYTNEDLESDNGEYFEGVTDDGLVLFRDGPDDEPRRRASP